MAHGAGPAWTAAGVAAGGFVAAWFAAPLRRLADRLWDSPADGGIVLVGCAMALALVGRLVFRRGP